MISNAPWHHGGSPTVAKIEFRAASWRIRQPAGSLLFTHRVALLFSAPGKCSSVRVPAAEEGGLPDGAGAPVGAQSLFFPVGQEDVSGTFLSIPPCDSITVRRAAASPSVNPHYHHPPQLLLSLPLSHRVCVRLCVCVCLCVHAGRRRGRQEEAPRTSFLSSPGSRRCTGLVPVRTSHARTRCCRITWFRRLLHQKN